MVCGEPNRRRHGCHVYALGRVVQYRKKLYGSLGVLPKAVWRGFVDDRNGVVWSCAHRHDALREARECAQQRVRYYQRTGLGLPPVWQPRPGSTVDVGRRVPIADLPSAVWARMKRDHGNRCYYCGAEGVRLVKEHKVPLARGGANSAANIVPACAPCNLSKGTLTDEEFRCLLLDRVERARIERRPNDPLSRGHRSPPPTRTLSGDPLPVGEPTWAVRRWEEAQRRVEVPPRGAKPKEQLPPGMKRCTTCKEVLPVESFGSHRARKDGLNARCRMCANDAARRWNAENPARARVARRNAKKRAAARRRSLNGGEGPTPVESKTCPRCGEHKSADQFHIDRGKGDGLQRVCKACRGVAIPRDQRNAPPTPGADAGE
jgi:hypothetical protein